MLFRQLFDKESSTYTYLLADLALKEAILVDPVLERVSRDLQLIQELGLTLRYCLETHIHSKLDKFNLLSFPRFFIIHPRLFKSIESRQYCCVAKRFLLPNFSLCFVELCISSRSCYL